MHGHFNSLSQVRDCTRFPVFALEHGLSNTDLDQIKSVLRESLISQPLQCSDWLLWVIYATEVGYDYTGEEYWQTFEEQTPNWSYSDRIQIKKWFMKFQTTFNGVLPEGLWAEHFTIIAWPITHAILPVYLQRQFVRALFSLRYNLAAMTSLDPPTIGRLLTENVQIPTTRFQEFLQQEALIGRIVLALLGESTSDTNQPIFPDTLERIVSDLDAKRNSREWLKETRRVTSDRFKGIRNSPWPSPDSAKHRLTVPPVFDVTQLDIRPNLLLRHVGENRWSILFDIPSFRKVAALSPDLRSVLTSSRCRVNGTNDVKPAGWLLGGRRRRVAVQSWPDIDVPLIQLEQGHLRIDQLLQSECRLSKGPNWLFLIGMDGIGRQILNNTVRPDCEYVLVTTEELLPQHEVVSSCKLNCNTVKSYRLSIPAHASAELHSWLAQIGLQITYTIKVWPAGLPGRNWDGDGKSEWLTTEKPCIGLSSDHPVKAYSIQLNDGLEHTVQSNGTKEPIFVRLPALPVGTHSLTVTECRDEDLRRVASSSPAQGFAEFLVREPDPWIPGETTFPCLVVTIDPIAPDLDTFRQNDIRLSVIGPAYYTVCLTVELLTDDGCSICREQVANAIDLPIHPEQWNSRFTKLLERIDSPEYLFDTASSARLIIDGGTLGKYTIDFKRETKPLRWVTRRKRSKFVVKLIDDSGFESTDAEVHSYRIESPLQECGSTTDTFKTGITVQPPGVLFYAEHNQHHDVVVVSDLGEKLGLQGFAFSPTVGEIPRKAKDLSEALIVLKRWLDARRIGFHIDDRHQRVIHEILTAIYGTICGSNWARAESRFCEDPSSVGLLEELILTVAKTARLPRTLILNQSYIDMSSDDRTKWFFENVARYGGCKDPNVCEFALRLGYQPSLLSRVPYSQVHDLIAKLLNNPETLRSARLLDLNKKRTADGSPTS